mmetsp:Transcript_74993/g.160597  ORF Transcript_74993/g.160597 Transcript_74993/m.160597 type:complete len:205 (-) Transcript_74993:105-719(-)
MDCCRVPESIPGRGGPQGAAAAADGDGIVARAVAPSSALIGTLAIGSGNALVALAAMGLVAGCTWPTGACRECALLAFRCGNGEPPTDRAAATGACHWGRAVAGSDCPRATCACCETAVNVIPCCAEGGGLLERCCAEGAPGVDGGPDMRGAEATAGPTPVLTGEAAGTDTLGPPAGQAAPGVNAGPVRRCPRRSGEKQLTDLI